MLIQYYGSVIDQWLRGKETDPTVFEICADCYDDIVCGDTEAKDVLVPKQKNEPTDKFLDVIAFVSQGTCEICKKGC